MASESADGDGFDPDDVLFEQAVAAHEGGRLEEAETLYRMVLVREPDDAVVHELLGQVLMARNDIEASLECLKRSVVCDPSSPGAWLALAAAHHARGEVSAAACAVDRSLALKQCTSASVLRVVLLGEQGEHGKCEAEITRLLASVALDSVHLRSLASVARRLACLESLEVLLLRLDDASEGEIDELCGLANVHQARGDDRRFERMLRSVCARHPSHGGAPKLLATALFNRGRVREAIEVLDNAISLSADAADLRLTLSVILDHAGEHDRASRERRKSVESGGNWSASLVEAAACLRRAYRSVDELRECRERFVIELNRCDRELQLSPEAAVAAAKSLMSTAFFLIPAQGFNDREVARMLGSITTRVMDAVIPESAFPTKRSARGDRIRVGVLSAYFCRHSNWRTHLHGLTLLDPGRVELVAYSVPSTQDSVRGIAEGRVSRFVRCAGGLIDLICRIVADDLDAIVIPEVGMNPLVRLAAAKRLAPIQITSWGHPISSGYRSCDWFMSSDLMEPDDGQSHYTERLLRLPGTGMVVETPRNPIMPAMRSLLALDESRIRYWCCQAIHKLLPQHDWMYPEIASRLPQAVFVFIGPEDASREILAGRLRSAFAARGLDSDRHVVWLPPCDAEEFASIGAAMDVFLDCPAWSGCNTALDSIWSGTPIVAMDGDSMRARHASAMLRAMGLEQCIAADVEGLVELAVRAGRDAAWRRHLSELVVERRERLYDDRSPIRFLERFLEAQVGR